MYIVYTIHCVQCTLCIVIVSHLSVTRYTAVSLYKPYFEQLPFTGSSSVVLCLELYVADAVVVLVAGVDVVPLLVVGVVVVLVAEEVEVVVVVEED